MFIYLSINWPGHCAHAATLSDQFIVVIGIVSEIEVHAFALFSFVINQQNESCIPGLISLLSLFFFVSLFCHRSIPVWFLLLVTPRKIVVLSFHLSYARSVDIFWCVRLRCFITIILLAARFYIFFL